MFNRVRKAWAVLTAVEGFKYDGTFPLSFLADDEVVRAGHRPGDCEIVTPTFVLIVSHGDHVSRDKTGQVRVTTSYHALKPTSR
jgi:hypothetical protein